jgi:hypothetical protein
MLDVVDAVACESIVEAGERRSRTERNASEPEHEHQNDGIYVTFITFSGHSREPTCAGEGTHAYTADLRSVYSYGGTGRIIRHP